MEDSHRKTYKLALNVSRNLLYALDESYDLYSELKSEKDKEALLDVISDIKTGLNKIQGFVKPDTSAKKKDKDDEEEDGKSSSVIEIEFLEGLMPKVKKGK